MADKPSILIIAHRGESYDAPENTLAAFDLAWQRGAAAIELDVYLTADAKLVCCHDATTDRTSGGSAKLLIKDQTLAALQAIDVGSWKSATFATEKMPALDAVLAAMPPGKQIFVEIKCGVEAIDELKNVLRRANRPARDVVIICFDSDVCRAAKRALPDHNVLWLVMQRRDESTGQWRPTPAEITATARDAGVDGLDIEGAKADINRAAIQQYHAAGLECCAWTINDPARAKQLIEAGIDAITIDRCNWLQSQLSDR